MFFPDNGYSSKPPVVVSDLIFSPDNGYSSKPPVVVSDLIFSPDNGFSSKPPVVGILGPATSDNAIALANLCNVLQIPQVNFKILIIKHPYSINCLLLVSEVICHQNTI